MSNAILENDEPLIGLAEAAKKYNKHPASFTRWIVSGCTAADGSRVKLEAVRVGYKWATSFQATSRFLSRLSSIGETARDRVIPPADRRKQVAAAIREMELAGA